jgi:hypothetical protein
VKGQIYNIGGELISERDASVAGARAAGATGKNWIDKFIYNWKGR